MLSIRRSAVSSDDQLIPSINCRDYYHRQINGCEQRGKLTCSPLSLLPLKKYLSYPLFASITNNFQIVDIYVQHAFFRHQSDIISSDTAPSRA